MLRHFPRYIISSSCHCSQNYGLPGQFPLIARPISFSRGAAAEHVGGFRGPLRPLTVAGGEFHPDLAVRNFATKKTGETKAKKAKNSSTKALDDLLDDLDDDDDDDEEVNVGHKGGAASARTKEGFALADTPAARFISDAEKNHKKLDGKAKQKGKVAAAGQSHPLAVDYSDVVRLFDVEKYWDDMGVALEEQREFFVRHLSVRSSNSLDDLEVELEGDRFPLQEVASISKKDPKRLVIDCSSFPQAAASIVKALRSRSQSLNLNPQQEGTRIYVALPKVTREHREKLAKDAKDRLNRTKDDMRRLQNARIKELSDLEQSGDRHAPKDHFLAVKNIIQAIEHHFIHLAEGETLKKQNDILGK